MCSFSIPALPQLYLSEVIEVIWPKDSALQCEPLQQLLEDAAYSHMLNQIYKTVDLIVL